VERPSAAGEPPFRGPFQLALRRRIVPAFLVADRSTATWPGGSCWTAAPCTVMVFVWSNFVDGEPQFTRLTRSALNDITLTDLLSAVLPTLALLFGLRGNQMPIPVEAHFSAGSANSLKRRSAPPAPPTVRPGRVCHKLRRGAPGSTDGVHNISDGSRCRRVEARGG
jgi:hypothetical protein